MGIFHTTSLPVRVGVSRLLAWPVQDPATIRTCLLDCARWCADSGLTIVDALVLAPPGLTGGGVVATDTSVQVTFTGGVLGQNMPVAITLLLSNGDRENVVVLLPVRELLPRLPDGAVAIGSLPIVIDGVPIDVTDMTPLPGGQQGGDVALVYRPAANGVLGQVHTVAVQALGSGGGGGGEFAYVQALPAATWTIAHALGRHPSVSVVTTSGDLVEGDVRYADANTVVLNFAAGFAGTAYLT